MTNLEEENKILKRKLSHAQQWMKKEISTREMNIASQIEEQIYAFFPVESLSHFPAYGLENIVSSEIIFRHIIDGENLDGMGVIIGYQKVIDDMVELYITKGFRKYAQKHSSISSPINTPLEKSLHSVVHKKYILSLGRIYGLLKDIASGKKLNPYTQLFSDYLKSRLFLQKALLGTQFLLQLELLIRLHAVTDKRHSGTLSKKDTIEARSTIIGNFTDTNCILYILAASQNVDI